MKTSSAYPMAYAITKNTKYVESAFGKYTLKGNKENYREVLFTLPQPVVSELEIINSKKICLNLGILYLKNMITLN